MIATRDRPLTRHTGLPEVPDLECLVEESSEPSPEQRRDVRERRPARTEHVSGATRAPGVVVEGFDEFCLDEPGGGTSGGDPQSVSGDHAPELDFGSNSRVGVADRRIEVTDGDGFDALGWTGSDELSVANGSLELADATLEPSATAEGHRSLRIGEPPNRVALEHSHEDINELSAYGAVPSFALLTPIYAVRVTLRRRKLAAELAQAELGLDESLLERDRLLASVARRMRSTLDTDGRFARALEDADALERRLGVLGNELACLEDSHAKDSAEREGRVNEARHRLDQAKQAESGCATELDSAERNHARIEAKRKRLEIEYRNLGRQTTGVTEGEPSEAASDILERLETLEPERSALRGAISAAQKRYDSARSATRKAESELVRRETAARTANEGFARQRMTGVVSVRAEETVWVTALSNVMRSVLAAPGSIELEGSDLDAFRESDSSVAERAMVAERHARACGSHDPAAVRLGLVLLGVAVALVLAALSWVALS